MAAFLAASTFTHMLPALGFCILEAWTDDRDVCSFVHAATTAFVALLQVPFMMQANLDASDTNIGMLSATLTLNYMLYDLKNIKTTAYCLHHTMAIVASAYVVLTGLYGNMVLYIGINEVSTIFLILAQRNPCTLLRVFFAATFFLCRPCWLTWMLYAKPMDDSLILTLFLGHYAVNLWWLACIARRAFNPRRSA